MWIWKEVDLTNLDRDFNQKRVYSLNIKNRISFSTDIEVYYKDFEIPDIGLKYSKQTTNQAPLYKVITSKEVSTLLKDGEIGIDPNRNMVLIPKISQFSNIKSLMRGLISSQAYKDHFYALHSSIVMLDNEKQAIAFVGPSGSGKTFASKVVENDFKGKILIKDWALIKKTGAHFLAYDLNFPSKIIHTRGIPISSFILLTEDCNANQFSDVFNFILKSNEYIPFLNKENTILYDRNFIFWKDCYYSHSFYTLQPKHFSDHKTSNYLKERLHI